MEIFLVLLKWKLFKLKWNLSKVKWMIWNRGIFLFWCLLWIRKDEFHYSLDIDLLALIGTSSEWKNWYLNSINTRRKLAHDQDLSWMNRFFFSRELLWRNS